MYVPPNHAAALRSEPSKMEDAVAQSAATEDSSGVADIHEELEDARPETPQWPCVDDSVPAAPAVQDALPVVGPWPTEVQQFDYEQRLQFQMLQQMRAQSFQQQQPHQPPRLPIQPHAVPHQLPPMHQLPSCEGYDACPVMGEEEPPKNFALQALTEALDRAEVDMLTGGRSRASDDVTDPMRQSNLEVEDFAFSDAKKSPSGPTNFALKAAGEALARALDAKPKGPEPEVDMLAWRRSRGSDDVSDAIRQCGLAMEDFSFSDVKNGSSGSTNFALKAAGEALDRAMDAKPRGPEPEDPLIVAGPWRREVRQFKHEQHEPHPQPQQLPEVRQQSSDRCSVRPAISDDRPPSNFALQDLMTEALERAEVDMLPVERSRASDDLTDAVSQCGSEMEDFAFSDFKRGFSGSANVASKADGRPSAAEALERAMEAKPRIPEPEVAKIGAALPAPPQLQSRTGEDWKHSGLDSSRTCQMYIIPGLERRQFESMSRDLSQGRVRMPRSNSRPKVPPVECRPLQKRDNLVHFVLADVDPARATTPRFIRGPSMKGQAMSTCYSQFPDRKQLTPRRHSSKQMQPAVASLPPLSKKKRYQWQ